MAKKYASETKVSPEKSRAEIETLLQQYGATSTAVFNTPGEAAIAFEMSGRRVVVRLRLPRIGDDEIAFVRTGARGRQRRTEAQARDALARATRQKWRALLLSIRAKLVSIEEGVETFEEAFLAHVVMPDGGTVLDHVRGRVELAYQSKQMVPLLPRYEG